MRRAAPVRQLVAGRVKVEAGDPRADLGPKVAVLAQWSAQPVLSRSLVVMAGELAAHGYTVVLTSACESPRLLLDADLVPPPVALVLRKPNLGYDFGSWSVALGTVPSIIRAEQVILLNDSMAGPFLPLGPVLAGFESSVADIWGLTDTYQFGHHLQSYFLGFRAGVLADPPLRAFWEGVRHEPDKDAVIARGELGLSRLLHEEGYVQAPAFPHEGVVDPGHNPVIRGWRQLLDRGFPFLKREILRNPGVAPAGDTARAVVKRITGHDVDAWVEDRAA